MEETILKSLTEEKNKSSNIFKNINTNSNYLKNLIGKIILNQKIMIVKLKVERQVYFFLMIYWAII